MRNLLLLLLVFLYSCNKDDVSEHFNMEIGTGLYVVNELGEDLLNPEHPDAINFNTIELFYLIDGEQVSPYNANADCPRGISLEKPNNDRDKYYLCFAFNTKGKADITYTTIKWNESDKDTFKVEFRRGDGFILTSKCWLNDELVWDNTKERIITIVK